MWRCCRFTRVETGQKFWPGTSCWRVHWDISELPCSSEVYSILQNNGRLVTLEQTVVQFVTKCCLLPFWICCCRRFALALNCVAVLVIAVLMSMLWPVAILTAKGIVRGTSPLPSPFLLLFLFPSPTCPDAVPSLQLRTLGSAQSQPPPNAFWCVSGWKPNIYISCAMSAECWPSHMALLMISADPALVSRLLCLTHPIYRLQYSLGTDSGKHLDNKLIQMRVWTGTLILTYLFIYLLT